ncbi:MAG: AEC family transporter [Anaerolineae bacterium]|nr:AEC family transporter [Anaerolineae bacterium]MCA9893278.1 AEC family transporter [Anaerolineae bacterium]
MLLSLLEIMLTVIAPIFLIIGGAWYISRQFKPDPRSLSPFLIYLFIPALVFRGIYNTEITAGELGGVAFVVLGAMGIMAGIGMAYSRIRGFDARMEGAFVLSIILVNAANYGIPLNTFAFGEQGGQVAILAYVFNTGIGNILGVFFASRGKGTIRDAFMNVIKVPIGYAAIAGFIANAMRHSDPDFMLPQTIERAINIAADGSIPGMLALLGLQLSRVKLQGRLRPILVATGIRLMIAPFIGLTLATLIGLTGVTFNVAVVQASMPTAVLSSALATQFGSDAEFTSAVTFTSTLLSVITLSILIFILRGGT